jgi:hypothetical protein
MVGSTLARAPSGLLEETVEGAEDHKEATANEALIDALHCNDIANNARVGLYEEVNRTKRVAERVCKEYHKKAIVAVVDKSKLMHLVYRMDGSQPNESKPGTGLQIRKKIAAV